MDVSLLKTIKICLNIIEFISIQFKYNFIMIPSQAIQQGNTEGARIYAQDAIITLLNKILR